MSAEITATMDRIRVTPSSQLSSSPFTSSFPALASQPSVDSGSCLKRHQEQETPARREETMPSGALSAAGPPASAPRRSSYFRSLRPPRPSGPLQPLFLGRILLVAAASFACLHSPTLAAVVPAKNTRNPRRRIEDEFTGQWNGEWTASQDDDYVYGCNREGGCDDDASSGGGSSIWIDDADALALTPDQIITYVSAGLLAFMALLCCVCYPEIVTVTFHKLCGCCLGGKAAAGTGVGGGGGNNGDLEASYVGGMQEGKLKKKKRRNSKSSNKSSNSRKSRDVELV